MNILRATLSSLAGILSVREDQVDDALQSERLVKRTLSRRGMFQAVGVAAAAAALPTGLVLGEIPRAVYERPMLVLRGTLNLDQILRGYPAAYMDWKVATKTEVRAALTIPAR